MHITCPRLEDHDYNLYYSLQLWAAEVSFAWWPTFLKRWPLIVCD